MKRRELVRLAAAALFAAGAAGAETLEESVERQLRAQGFGKVDVSRTLLGRTRIVAESADQRREIILNPRTGEILRDYWEPLKRGAGSPGAEQIFDSSEDGGETGGGGDRGGEDDGDDDGGSHEGEDSPDDGSDSRDN